MKQAKRNIDKQDDMFGDFIQEVFGKSPFEESSRIWNETTKKIKEKQNEK